MCRNLVERGTLDAPLIIFNRTSKRAQDLHAKLPSGKSIVARTIDEAVAKSDIIFWCLGDDAAVKDTVAIMTKGDVKGKLFVDCSTIHPDTTNMIARDIEAQSAQFVACPGVSTAQCFRVYHTEKLNTVFGAPAMAEYVPGNKFCRISCVSIPVSLKVLVEKHCHKLQNILGSALTPKYLKALASSSVSLPVQRQLSIR